MEDSGLSDIGSSSNVDVDISDPSLDPSDEEMVMHEEDIGGEDLEDEVEKFEDEYNELVDDDAVGNDVVGWLASRYYIIRFNWCPYFKD